MNQIRTDLEANPRVYIDGQKDFTNICPCISWMQFINNCKTVIKLKVAINYKIDAFMKE